MSYFDNENKYGGNSDVSEEEASVNSDDSDAESESEIVLKKKVDIEEDLDISDDEIEDDGDEEINSDDDDEEDLEMEGGAKEDLEEGEIDELEETENKTKKTKKIPAKTLYKPAQSDSDEEYDDEEGELYLQKFDKEINDNYILNFHPECALQNYDEILSMIKVIRDKNGIIIDSLHRTIPYLTKFEKARILGQRAKQINSGSTPFVKVPENVIDGYLIAELELKEKRIPFIIRRPMPNGGSEYWSIRDLEDISF